MLVPVLVDGEERYALAKQQEQGGVARLHVLAICCNLTQDSSRVVARVGEVAPVVQPFAVVPPQAAN